MDRLEISAIVRAMATVLTQMPEHFAAGTTLQYRKTYADYSGSSGWVVTLHLAGPKVASDQGNDLGGGVWEFAVSSVNTGALTAGVYRWVERAVNSGLSQTVDLASGLVTVTPDLAQASDGSAQSWEEKMLASVNTGIEAIVSGKMASYQVAGRGAEYLSLEELTKLRGELVAAVQRQRRGGRPGKQHLINFRRAG